MELFNRLSLSYIGSEPLCPVVMGCDLVHGAVAATKIRLSWNIGRRGGGHLPPHRNYLFPDELIEISVHLCTLH